MSILLDVMPEVSQYFHLLTFCVYTCKRRMESLFLKKKEKKTSLEHFQARKYFFLRIYLKEYNLVPACSIGIIPSVTETLERLHTTLRLDVPFLCFYLLLRTVVTVGLES